MRRIAVAAALLSLAAMAFAMPSDPGFVVYFAPILTSSHMGVTADNLPAIHTEGSSSSLVLQTSPEQATPRFGFGGKFGLAFRPEAHDRRNRLDIEIQGEYFASDFHYRHYDDTLDNQTTRSIRYDGFGLVGRLRWSGDVDERVEPFVHVGYGVNFLSLGSAVGLGYGYNIGAGMRVRMCDKFGFYFEYENSPMGEIQMSIPEIDPAMATLGSGDVVGLQPGYQQVSVGFEFYLRFCANCDNNNWR